MLSKDVSNARAKSWRSLVLMMSFLALLLGGLQPGVRAADADVIAIIPSDSLGLQPLVVRSTRNDLSPALRGLYPRQAAQGPARDLPNFKLPKAIPPTLDQPKASGEAPSAAELLKQGILGSSNMPAPLTSFDGVSNLFGGWPPDTQGDIGSSHYVQWINLHFAIWEIDRQDPNSTTKVYGPVPGNTLFQGFGGDCETTNDGDPITLYDPLAGRWFMSQFALPNWPYGPFYACVAVSQTEDPTGAWHRYEFQMPVNKMNDYPKFGVWPDAYYMTVNQYNAGSMSPAGAGVAAMERAAMLDGEPARMVYFDLYSVDANYGGMLPADFDGLTPPPPGAPGYFVEWDDGAWIPPQDALRLWEFHVDWVETANSTFGLAGVPNQVIETAEVDANMCNQNRNCIPQPGTSTKLDAIADRLMHRLQYRNFGSYETLVSNHTVDVDTSDHAGIHWLELRKNGSSWSLYQEGIYAPNGDNRWMGSAAMDHSGNLALGYSVSSVSNYPSVRYTGRLAGDALGSLPQGEQSLVEGGGSQTGSNRWGDYSMLGLDPVDDCTFWYTQEYVAATGTSSWKTRIGAFRFPSCVIGPRGTLEGVVTDSNNGEGIKRARVSASQSVTQTYSILTGDDGLYQMQIPTGVYTLTASAFAYLPAVDTGIEVFSGTISNKDFALDPAPMSVISGYISDAGGGWPLYARIDVGDTPLASLWSDPVSGYYSVTLPQGAIYTLDVEAVAGIKTRGYLPAKVEVGPLWGDIQQDILLEVDALVCDAPGYRIEFSEVYGSDFEVDGGGLVISGTTSWAWGPTATGTGPGMAYSGDHLWATNLDGNYLNNEDGYLILEGVDLSGSSASSLEQDQFAIINWQQWLRTELGYDFASMEVSKDGGSTWIPVYGPEDGNVDLEWQERYAILDASYLVSDLRVRFHFESDYTITYAGWYLDDLRVGLGRCAPQSGGLVVGNVYDANTLQGLNGAQILDESGGVTISKATPSDPGLGDGFYMLFSPSGSHFFTATIAGPVSGQGYQAAVENPNAVISDTIRQDFYLEAGWLTYDPLALEMALQMGTSAAMSITITNHGGAQASFELVKMNRETLPLGPFENPEFVVKPFKQGLPTSERLGLPDPLPARANFGVANATLPSGAGDVIRSWVAEGVEGAWGIAYDGRSDTVWVSSPASAWAGVDRLFEFTPDGVATGRWYGHTAPHSVGPADLAYNWNTGMMWVMNVNSGVANCIYEIDPDSGYTGEAICPGGGNGFTNSQRGLAYDPATDSWFGGGWNDLSIYRFDSQGNVLSSVFTGLAISGLAFNPDSQHLFVMVNDSPNPVYVLDVANDYDVVGQFIPSQGFGDYAGSGLEIDCEGRLWAVDQQDERIYQFDSGESASFCSHDIPWLSLEQITATLSPSASQLVTASLDASVAAVDQPGIYRAQLKIIEDTPYTQAVMPVTMTVSAPPSWGKLAGIVTGLGYCDSTPAVLNGAEVLIQSSTGLSRTVMTDSSGYYQRWLDTVSGPYTLTVSAAEHAPILRSGITVTALGEGGETAVQDFDLHWLRACVGNTPEAFDVMLKQGRSITLPLSLENSGYAASSFELVEIPSDISVPTASPHSSYVLLDEGFEGGVMPPPGWVKVDISVGESWEIASSAPHSGSYYARELFDFDQDNWLLSPELYLVEGQLSFWSFGSLYWCAQMYDNCDLNLWIVVGGVGGGDDIYIGRADDDWAGSWMWSQSTFDLTPLLPGGPVRIGFQYQGSDGAEIALDDILLEGVEGSDVPWLAVTPVTGTLAISSTQVVSVTLDASLPEVYEPGDYHALLKLKSQDPLNESIGIPLTMTVVPLEYGVDISNDAGLHDIPGEMVSYTLTVTNTSEGPIDSFDLSLGAHVWPTSIEKNSIGLLAQGESADFLVWVQIPEGASGGDSDSVSVTATSQGDPSKTDSALLTTGADTPSADLEVFQSISADPIEVGEVVTYTLVITNHGPTKAIRVTLVDVLPAGVYYLSDDGATSGGVCSITGQVLACQWGKLLVGEKKMVHVVVNPLRPGILVNQLVAVADSGDPIPGNNWYTLHTLSEGYLIYLPLISRSN